MPNSRLDSVSPVLAQRFRGAPPTRRHEAVRVACELAVSSVGLTGQEVIAALSALRSGAPADTRLRMQLEDLAARFDDEYLDLQEVDDPARRSESLLLFSKARAASALALALYGSADQLHEALYEAIVAMNDADELVRLAELALQ